MEDPPPPPPSPPPTTSVVEDEIHLKPSIFELLAEEQLRDLLHPVVRYVLSVSARFDCHTHDSADRCKHEVNYCLLCY